jgi:multisubunit Na+/H+ antiporter MnhE subunit
MIHRTWLLLLGMLVGGGFYMVLIDSADLPELIVFAGVAVGCGVAFLVSHEQGVVEARVNPLWLWRVWRLAWQIPLDIAIVSWTAVAQLFTLRASRGEFRAVKYAAVGDTPPQTGRRALTEGFGSVAPNTIVVGIDDERGLLLVHQLRRQGAPEDIDVLKLG